MPNPTQDAQHVSRPLTNLAVKFAADQPFRAMDVFPVVPVAQKQNTFYVYDAGDLNRLQSVDTTRRAPATESSGGGYRLSTQPYSCEQHAWHKDVTPNDRANADTVLAPERTAVQYTTRIIKLSIEQLWTNAFFTAGVWSNEPDQAAAQWSSDATDVINVVDTETDAIEQRTFGHPANFMAINKPGWTALKNHADIIGRMAITEAQIATPDLIAAIFELDEIIVLSAAADTADEGQAEAPGWVHGNHALVGYRAPSPSIDLPSAGYTFLWTGLIGSRKGWQTKRIPMPLRDNATRVETQTALDQHQVSDPCATLFRNVA